MKDHEERGSARWATVRHVVESIAIVAAGLWAAYVFIYQERIKPTFEPPSLQVTVTLDPGKPVNGTRIAQLHFEFVNTGQVDTDVYADSASVYGDRYAPAAALPSPSYGPDSEVNRMVQTTKRELIYSYATLRDAAIGGIPGHLALTPGQRFERVIPIAIKNGRFDELYADVRIIFGRYQRGRHHFSRVSIQRDETGAVYLKRPEKPTEDDGNDDSSSVQTTL